MDLTGSSDCWAEVNNCPWPEWFLTGQNKIRLDLRVPSPSRPSSFACHGRIFVRWNEAPRHVRSRWRILPRGGRQPLDLGEEEENSSAWDFRQLETVMKRIPKVMPNGWSRNVRLQTFGLKRLCGAVEGLDLSSFSMFQPVTCQFKISVQTGFSPHLPRWKSITSAMRPLTMPGWAWICWSARLCPRTRKPQLGSQKSPVWTKKSNCQTLNC